MATRKPRKLKGHPNGPVPTPADFNPLEEPITNPLPKRWTAANKRTLESLIAASTMKKTVIPANQYLIDRATKFKAELPQLLSPRMASVREFVLTEALPLLASVQDGILDAADVIKQVTEEPPDVSRVSSLLSGLSALALRIRAVNFVAGLVNMTPDEQAMFRFIDLSLQTGTKNGSNDLQAIMREMQSLSKLQRPAQNNSKTRVRPLPAAEGRGDVDNGLPPRAPRSRRRTGIDYEVIR
jgi:hypothetical protein